MSKYLHRVLPISCREYLNKRIRYSARPPICEDVAEVARKKSWPVIDLHPPVYQELCQQVGDDEFSRQLLELDRADYERSQCLIAIPSGTVRDHQGVIFLPDGMACQQGNWVRVHLTESMSYRARFRKKSRINGDVFSLLGHWSSEYYHWFHDTLPRLWASLPHLPRDTQFVIHARPHEYQLASLDALGIDSDRLISQPNAGDIVAARLWFATPLGHTNLTAGEGIRSMARAIVAQYAAPHSMKHDRTRLYVSRNNARWRRIINEPEITPILKSLGFQKVNFESMAFADQVALCNTAGIIVGPHGAGLSNIMFCETGCIVGEIGFQKVPRHYTSMARHFGHDYHRLMSQPANVEDQKSDLWIDPREFSQWLSKLASEESVPRP